MNKTAKYLSKTHGTFSFTDISMCSTNIVDHFEWNVGDNSYSCDQITSPQLPKFSIHKVGWIKYKLFTKEIPPYVMQQDLNEVNELLNL